MLLRRWAIPLLTLTAPALFSADPPAPELRASPPPLVETPQADAPVPAVVPEVFAEVPPPKPQTEKPPQKPSALDYFGKGTRAEVITLQQAIHAALKNNLDAKIEEIGIALENARVKNSYGTFDPVFSFSAQRQRIKTPDATDNIRNADSLLRLQDVALASQVVNSGIAAFNSTQVGVANFLAEIDRRIQAISNQGVLNFALPSLNYQPQLAAPIAAPAFSSDIVTFKQAVDTAEAGLQMRTPIGTIIGVTVRGNKTHLSFVGDTRDVLPTYGASATFEFRQPLLKDAGLNANLADIRIAKKNREAQELNWKFRIEVALQSVVGSYYQMVQGFSDLENKGDAINASIDLLAFSNRREQLGFFSPYEVGQAQVQLSDDEANLFGAQTYLLDRQTILKSQILAQFDSRDNRVYLPENLPALKVPKLDIEQLLRTAFSKRTDYKALIVAADAENVRLKFADNQMWPQLDVVGSYGYTGLDRDFGGATDALIEGEAPQWQLGINGSVPLGRIQAKAQREAARARKEQAIARIKQAELQIGLSVRRTVDAILNNQRALIASKATTAAAKGLVKVGLKRMESGLLSSFELIEQQRRVYTARSLELTREVALNIAITELWLATGTVLENLGVEYEDTVDERKLWERVTQPPPLAKPYLPKGGKPIAETPAKPSGKSAQKPTPAPERPGLIKPSRFESRKHFWQK